MAKRITRCAQGAIALEMALILPLLVFAFIGFIELNRMMLLNQKVQKTAGAYSDLITQFDAMPDAQLNKLFAAAKDMMAPFPIDTDMKIVISSIGGTPSGVPELLAQKTYGAALYDSRVAPPDDGVHLPDGFELQSTERIIASEVFYSYKGLIFSGLFGWGDVYKVAFSRPRSGGQTTFE